MLGEVFAIIAPIFLCAAVGYFWAFKKLPYNAEFVGTLVMNIGAPCLIISTLGEVDIPDADIEQMALVTGFGMVLVSAAAYLALRLSGLSYRVYLPGLVFPNTGNMGLPLCLFAFGEQGLALALILFIVISTLHFSLGVALVSGQAVWRSLSRSPVVYAAGIALLQIYTGWELPLWAKNSVGLLGDMSIPLMLIALGVSLHSLQIQNLPRSLALSALRLALGFAVGLAVVEIWQLQGAIRGVVLIEFAMPAAVFNYLLAFRYQQRPEEVAGLVVGSTALSFLSLPFLLWLAL